MLHILIAPLAAAPQSHAPLGLIPPMMADYGLAIWLLEMLLIVSQIILECMEEMYNALKISIIPSFGGRTETLG